VTPGSGPLRRAGNGGARGGGAGDVRALLREFLARERAQLVLVIDPAGGVITAAGNPGGLDPTAFASVCAAHFEANLQLASLLGEPGSATLLHQGQASSICLAGIGTKAVLATVYEGTRYLEDVGPAGSAVASRLEAPVGKLLGASTAMAAEGIGSEWVRAVEDQIERVFKQGV
jgi:hypothetical protein